MYWSVYDGSIYINVKQLSENDILQTNNFAAKSYIYLKQTRINFAKVLQDLLKTMAFEILTQKRSKVSNYTRSNISQTNKKWT